MIYLWEQLFLHDKGLNLLYKLGNLHRNKVLPWWFHLSPHIIVATMIAPYQFGLSLVMPKTERVTC